MSDPVPPNHSDPPPSSIPPPKPVTLKQSDSTNSVSGDIPKDLSPAAPEGAITPTGSDISVKSSGIPGPKPSGLKAPSKIGRPCSGIAKPALPPVPVKNSPDSDVKRDEYRRQKLTDVEEEVDECDDVENKSRSPTPRKTRNYSDTSVVLTEDTDCFIIGMRVWVGGTKPGQIAYLGETQFAPGEWAGIVLDEPIGKNDGSVSGIRYFQCEAKKGVFSRLTRLTLSPISDAEARRMSVTSTNGTRKSPVSPSGSTRSLLKNPGYSLNTSTTSLSSSHPEIKVGDRVIVQSSQGSKPGTLRFMGPTDFAKGEWCGVELDDPLGKNDGAVEGTRYFTCAPKFGLFAPISKVSKSPSSRRSTAACIVHKGPGSTTGSMTPLRRAGSKESMTSAVSATSAASGVRRVRLGVAALKKTVPKTMSTPHSSRSPLQDVIKEKEHHIEQLLKEREIDRSEITRAATIAEKAEGQLLSLQQEYEKYRLENEAKYREQSSIIAQLEKQKQEILGQLEDEKKKLEDAQFRFEEESLTRDDVETTNKANLARIQQLESSLKQEQLKNEKLELETKRLFETEEILAKIQEEMEKLQQSQEKTTKNIEVKDSEISNLKQKLEEVNSSLLQEQRKLKEKSKDIETIIEENNILLKEKEAYLEKLKEELNSANKLLKEKHIGNEINLLKEMKKIEMDLSAKTYDCETSSEKCKDLEKKISILQEELNSLKSEQPESEKEERWRNNVEEVRTILKSTISELLRVRKEYAIELLEKEMSLREKDIKLNYEIMEIQKLKADFAHTIVEISQNSKSCRERYARQIELRNVQIEELLNSLQLKSRDLIGRQTFSTRLEYENSQNNLLLSKYKTELEIFNKKQTEQNAYIAKLVEELKTAKIKASEFERKYNNSEKSVLELKQALEKQDSQFQSLIDASKDSNKQLSILSDELKKSEQQILNLKLEFSKKLDSSSNIEQELRFTLQNTQDQFKIEKNYLEEQLRIAQSNEMLLREKLDLLTTDAAKIQEQLMEQINDLNQTLEKNELEYKKQLEANLDKIKELEQILEMTVAEHQLQSSNLNRRIEELTAERDELKISVREKTELLIISEENLKNYTNNQDIAHEKQLTNLKKEILDYKNQIENSNKKILEQNEEINTLRNQKSLVEHNLKEENLKLTNQMEECTKLNVQFEQLKITHQLADENLAKLTEQHNSLQLEKQNFEKLINEHQIQLTSLKEEIKDLQTVNSNISNNILERDKKLTSISEEIKQFQNLKANLESTNLEKDNKISALTAQIEEIIKDKGTTSETFATQEKKILELNMNLQKLNQEKNTIANEIYQKQSEIITLTETLAKLREETTKNLQNKDEEITKLKQQIEEVSSEKENISRSMNDSAQNVSSLNHEIELLKNVKSKLEELAKDNELKLQNLKNGLQSATEENSIKTEKLQQLDNLIKEKDSTLDNLEKELKILQEKWSNPYDHPVVKDLSIKLEENQTKLEEKRKELVNLNDRLQAISKAKGTDSEIITAQEEKLTDLKNELEKLKQDKGVLSANLKESEDNLTNLKKNFEAESNKLNDILKQKDKELNSIKEQLNSVEQEKKSSLTTIEDNIQSITKLTSEIENLKKNKAALEETIRNNENNFAKLKEEIQQSGDNSTNQTLKISELEENIKQKEIAISDLKASLTNLQTQWNQPSDHPIFKEISSKLEENNNLLQEKEANISNLSSEIERIDNQNKQLQQTWAESVQNWRTKLLNLENIRKLSAKQCDTIEEQLKVLAGNYQKSEVKAVKFEEFEKQIANDAKDIEKVLEKTQKLIIEREKELNREKNNYNDLQKEFEQTRAKLAEVGKQTQVSGIPRKTVKEGKETCDIESFKKMQEEKELAYGQVEFLNSIIVDMQQKNEQLQSKIQFLENGVLGESPPGNNMININRVIPPRKYCDICEMFDLHETEDCPIQMGEDPVVVQNEGKIKKIPEPRPYCDICEEFGHETQNCDADETF